MSKQAARPQQLSVGPWELTVAVDERGGLTVEIRLDRRVQANLQFPPSVAGPRGQASEPPPSPGRKQRVDMDL